MENYEFTNYGSLYKYITSTYNKKDFLNHLENGSWISFSTRDFKEKVELLALGLHTIGVEKNSTVGIVSPSSPYWLMVDFAIQIAGGISVPIFPNISSNHLEHEIKDADLHFLFLGNHLRESEFKHFEFKKIFTTDFDTELDNQIKLEDLYRLGEVTKHEKPKLFETLLDDISDDDMLSIIYTSGNTGVPKGVELTHKNVITQLRDIHKNYDINDSDKALSFLPLAHIFERTIMTFYMSRGVSVYFADDVKNVANLLKELHPTLLTVVPRLLEKIYSKMKTKIDNAPFIRKLLGTMARKRAMHKDPDLDNTFIDNVFQKAVYGKFQEAFGGNLKLLICGGSALDKDLYKFFLNIGLPLYQGYGMTEFAPVISANNPKENKWGTCGREFPSAEVKISNDGEVLVRGDSMMRGYHNLPELTADTLKDGWLHTGDLGELDSDGYLTIKSRKKELFKTSTGKYVNPIIIEQGIVKSNLIDFAVVIADNKKFTSALLFPDFDFFQTYIDEHKEHLPENYTIEDFFSYKKIKKELKKHMKRVNRDLDKWEKVKQYKVIFKQLSIDDGEITPSMKVKRAEIENKFSDVIREIYEEEAL